MYLFEQIVRCSLCRVVFRALKKIYAKYMQNIRAPHRAYSSAVKRSVGRTSIVLKLPRAASGAWKEIRRRLLFASFLPRISFVESRLRFIRGARMCTVLFTASKRVVLALVTSLVFNRIHLSIAHETNLWWFHTTTQVVMKLRRACIPIPSPISSGSPVINLRMLLFTKCIPTNDNNWLVAFSINRIGVPWIFTKIGFTACRLARKIILVINSPYYFSCRWIKLWSSVICLARHRVALECSVKTVRLVQEIQERTIGRIEAYRTHIHTVRR